MHSRSLALAHSSAHMRARALSLKTTQARTRARTRALSACDDSLCLHSRSLSHSPLLCCVCLARARSLSCCLRLHWQRWAQFEFSARRVRLVPAAAAVVAVRHGVFFVKSLNERRHRATLPLPLLLLPSLQCVLFLLLFFCRQRCKTVTHCAWLQAWFTLCCCVSIRFCTRRDIESGRESGSSSE